MFWFLVVFVGLPTLAYLCIKFGTFGYFAAKNKAKQLFKNSK
jgi:hypothetical protein